MNYIDVSVIICCYNSAKRLPTTLEYLAKQKVKDQLTWEIILVDNNSTDTTAEVALVEWKKHNNNTSFKIVKEPIPGLSNARKKGVEESTGKYLLFCDDDNWLSENYVQLAWDNMKQHPEWIMLGGKGEAVFEGQRPNWFDKYSTNYAVGEQKHRMLGNKKVLYLYGAGIVICRSFFTLLEAINFKSLLSDRKGKELTSGGDTEYCFITMLLNLQVGVSNDLTFKHFIPNGRETFTYLKRWHYGFGKTRIYFEIYRAIIRGESKPVNKTLKIPYWYDQWLYRLKQIKSYFPKILWIKEKEENFEYILEYKRLRGELAKRMEIKNNLLECYTTIETYREKGLEYLKNTTLK